MTYASIQRYTLTSTTPIGVNGGDGVGRIIIRFSEDTRLALSEGDLTVNYMTFSAGTVLVLDPPNLLARTDLFVRLDSASSGIVELLRC